MSETASLSFAQVLMEGIKEMVFVIKVVEEDSFIYEFFNTAVMEKTSLTSLSIGRTFHEVHSSKLASFLQEKYREAVQSRQCVVYEDSFYSAGKQLFYSKTHLTPLFDETGKCIQVVSLVKDVTDETGKGVKQTCKSSLAEKSIPNTSN